MTNQATKKSLNLPTFLITLFLFVLCYTLASRAYIFWDVSWHIEGAKRMLEGGTYFSNLLDDNPPTVFMFYIPYALLSKIVNLPSYKLFFFYLLSIYGISGYLTFQVLKKKLTSQYEINVFYFASILWVLFFGITILGQRENILFCLFTPYLYMSLLPQLSGNSLGKPKQLTISFLATIGILQNPFYIIIPVSLDLLDCITHRRKPLLYQSFFYSFVALFLILSYSLYPNYYTQLLRLLYHFQAGIDQPEQTVMHNLMFISLSCSLLITLLFTTLFYRKLMYLKIIFILFFTMLIYLLEHKAWEYHLYPVMCASLLAFSALHIDNKNSEKETLFNYILKKLLMVFFTTSLFLTLATISFRYFGNHQIYNDKNATINKLMAFSKSTNPKNNKTLFFDTRVYPAYLLKFYGNLNIISPWANNWMLPTLIKFKNNPQQIDQYFIGKNLLFNLTADTLKNHRPQYVIYYKARYAPYVSEENFDVIHYLKQNKKVAHELKKYQPLRRIDHFVILKRQTKDDGS